MINILKKLSCSEIILISHKFSTYVSLLHDNEINFNYVRKGNIKLKVFQNTSGILFYE